MSSVYGSSWVISQSYRTSPSYTPKVLLQVESSGLLYPNANSYRSQRIVIAGSSIDLSYTCARSYCISKVTGGLGASATVSNSSFDVYGSTTEATNAVNFLNTFANGDLLILNTYDEPQNNAAELSMILRNNFGATKIIPQNYTTTDVNGSLEYNASNYIVSPPISYTFGPIYLNGSLTTTYPFSIGERITISNLSYNSPPLPNTYLEGVITDATSNNITVSIDRSNVSSVTDHSNIGPYTNLSLSKNTYIDSISTNAFRSAYLLVAVKGRGVIFEDYRPGSSTPITLSCWIP